MIINKILKAFTHALVVQGKIDKSTELNSQVFEEISLDDLDLVEVTMLVENYLETYNIFDDDSVAQLHNLGQFLRYYERTYIDYKRNNG